MITYKLVERNEGQMPRGKDYKDEVERKFNENVKRLRLDPKYIVPDISVAFTWTETPEGGAYWAMASRLFNVEAVNEPEPEPPKVIRADGNRVTAEVSESGQYLTILTERYDGIETLMLDEDEARRLQGVLTNYLVDVQNDRRDKIGK